MPSKSAHSNRGWEICYKQSRHVWELQKQTERLSWKLFLEDNPMMVRRTGDILSKCSVRGSPNTIIKSTRIYIWQYLLNGVHHVYAPLFPVRQLGQKSIRRSFLKCDLFTTTSGLHLPVTGTYHNIGHFSQALFQAETGVSEGLELLENSYGLFPWVLERTLAQDIFSLSWCWATCISKFYTK